MSKIQPWHILTAGLICLAPAACGDRARVENVAPVEQTRSARTPTTTPRRESDLASTQPASKVTVLDPTRVEPPAKSREQVREEVLDSLTLAAEKEPEDFDARFKLARALVDFGRVREAREHAEEAVRLDEHSGAAWNLLGRIELAQKNMEAAEADLERATKEDEDSSYAWNNLGFVLLEQGKYEEAAAALESATAGEKPTAYMWNNLGMAYEHCDRIREARAAYRQAAGLGSGKGQSNVERLEGVVSLVPTHRPEGETAAIDAATPEDEHADEITPDE